MGAPEIRPLDNRTSSLFCLGRHFNCLKRPLERKDDAHLGEGTFLGIEVDGAAVAGENVHGEGEAEARSFAWGFRGDEGLEDALAQFL